MQRILIILLPVVFSLKSNGQRVPETNKNEWGVSVGAMACYPRKFSFTPAEGYPSLSTNVSPAANFKYRKRFGIDSTSYMFLESGIGYIRQFSDVPVDTVAVRMDEEFYDVPLIFGIAVKGTKHFGYAFTGGLKFAVLKKQDFYTKPSTAVSPFPNNGFGDYIKWGYSGDFTFNVYFGKRSIFSIGFYVFSDFASPLTKKSSVEVTAAYNAYGICWGMGRSF